MKINDSLYQCHYDIVLCTTEKDFQKQFIKCGVEKKDIPEFLPKGSKAYTHFISNGDMTAIVSIQKDKDKDNIYYLIHEAIHIFQMEIKYTGEINPSDEFQAYAITNLARNLIEAYKK